MTKGLLRPTVEELMDAHLDITAPACVDIQIKENGRVIWVNVNGVCILRICRIPCLEVQDNRKRG